jgi:hypothetical protein
MALRRLVWAAAAAWILRWAALETAAYAGRKLSPYGVAPRESPRAPGWMPGPFDR